MFTTTQKKRLINKCVKGIQAQGRLGRFLMTATGNAGQQIHCAIGCLLAEAGVAPLPLCDGSDNVNYVMNSRKIVGLRAMVEMGGSAFPSCATALALIAEATGASCDEDLHFLDQIQRIHDRSVDIPNFVRDMDALRRTLA